MPYIELSDTFSLAHKMPTGRHRKKKVPSRSRSERKPFMRNALNILFAILST